MPYFFTFSRALTNANKVAEDTIAVPPHQRPWPMSEKGIVSRGSSWVFAYKIIKTKLCATIDEIAKNDKIAEIRRIVWFLSRLTMLFNILWYYSTLLFLYRKLMALQVNHLIITGDKRVKLIGRVILIRQLRSRVIHYAY